MFWASRVCMDIANHATREHETDAPQNSIADAICFDYQISRNNKKKEIKQFSVASCPRNYRRWNFTVTARNATLECHRVAQCTQFDTHNSKKFIATFLVK